MKKSEMEREIRRLREEVDQLKAADAVSKTTWAPVYPPPSGTYWAEPEWKRGPWYIDRGTGRAPDGAAPSWSHWAAIDELREALATDYVHGPASFDISTPPWTARIIQGNRADEDGLTAIGVPA